MPVGTVPAKRLPDSSSDTSAVSCPMPDGRVPENELKLTSKLLKPLSSTMLFGREPVMVNS